MKRIWMSALLLLTALFAVRAQAQTVYDRGTMYGVMTVYERPDSLSDVRMVYFSGTPVEVLESAEDGAGEVFTHVCVANQLEGYALTRDSGGNEAVSFSEDAADGPKGILPMLVANPGGRGIVNLRDRPSRSGGVLAEIPNGTSVEVMGVKEDDMHPAASWAHVRVGGQTGFMQLNLLAAQDTEAYWRAVAGTQLILPMRAVSLNDVRPFNPPEIMAQELAGAIERLKTMRQVQAYFAALGMELTANEADFIPYGSPEVQSLPVTLADGGMLTLVKTQEYSFLLKTDAMGRTMLLDMLTEFSFVDSVQMNGTTWLIGEMGGVLDGGRGVYGCWYNVDARGADILYAPMTEQDGLGDALCMGEWTDTDVLIYTLEERTQTAGETVTVYSQIRIEGIKAAYTAEEIHRESVAEWTKRRAYRYDASLGRLVIADAL